MNVLPPRPNRKPATYADIEAAPEHLVAEIIDGELVTHPRPSPRHSGSVAALGVKLGHPFQLDPNGPGGWIFFDGPELRLRSHLLVPDIVGWRRESLTGYPDTNWFEIRPDWVCEVLSGSTEKRDRTVKMRIFGEAAIPHMWMVDPRQQTLEAFEFREGLWTKLGGWSSADEVRAPPFEAISFSLADLWPLDKPLGLNEDPTPYYAGDR
jgi:Uma2 family endonuclease